MNDDLNKLLTIYKETLVKKSEDLEEARLRLIEANAALYDISNVIDRLSFDGIENKEIKGIIDNYLKKIK